MSTAGARMGSYNPEVVVSGAIGPHADFCGGTAGPGASGTGYVTGLKLAVGLTATAGLDEGTCRIVSGDRCRVAGAYIGQTNLLIATSYSGLDGVIWGLDVAASPTVSADLQRPLFTVEGQSRGSIAVYPVQPLLEATRALVGTRDSRMGTPEHRRFPPLPGVHLVAAYKSGAGFGPAWVWSIIAIGILEKGEQGSNLFNEDGGLYGGASTAEHEVEAFLEASLRTVARSILECGLNHGVRYERIYAGAKAVYIPEAYYGCAIACGPYFTLAQRAVPKGWSAADLCHATTPQWETALSMTPLRPSEPVFLPPGEEVPGGVRLVSIGCGPGD